MKIKKGDKVKVISGKDRGKIGKVLTVFTATEKVLVEGVNIATRHVKPNTNNKEGGIVKVEKPIAVSNVMFYDEKDQKTVRIGYKLVNGKKYRINQKTKDSI